MAQYRQSWLCSAREWLGYLFTVLAGIPAAVFGWLLLARGVPRLSAILVSITLAVLGGFALEGGLVWLAMRKRVARRLIVSVPQFNLGTYTVSTASFILVVTSVPIQPNSPARSAQSTTAASSSSLVRA